MTALQDIVGYIVGNHTELGFSSRSPRKWVTELRKRSVDLNCLISEGILRQILTGKHGDTGEEVLGRLANIFRKKPVSKLHPNGGGVTIDFTDYVPFRTLTYLQFRLPSLEDFRQWEKEEWEKRGALDPEAAEQERLAMDAAQPGRVYRSYQFVAKTHADTPLAKFEMTIPAPRRPSALTRDKGELHYVTWRYALDSGGGAPKIAREVLTFKLEREMHHATMSYKLGSYDHNEVVRLFEGPVAFLGRSHMCIMVAVEETSPDWEADWYRGRVIFMRRQRTDTSHLTRFGLMATTRSDDEFAPCAACTIMMLADGVIGDIQEFRRLVTLVRPADEVLNRDFGLLPEDDRLLIESLLDNRPGMHRPPLNSGSGGPAGDHAYDMVLRLHLKRFDANMPRIRKWLLDPKNGSKNPIIKDWKSDGVFLAREDVAIENGTDI
jgi:hypothetical protein